MDSFEGFLDRLAACLDSMDAPAPPGAGIIHAAVGLLLRPPPRTAASSPVGSAEILFIRRAERIGDPWSGHIAFPGGRLSASDASLLAAAVRETLEEVGIDARGSRVLGRLPTLAPMSPHLPPIDVTPFVIQAPAGVDARPDPAEVKDAFWMPLASLQDTGPSDVVRLAAGGERREFHAYPSPAGPIWGITERILTQLLERAAR